MRIFYTFLLSFLFPFFLAAQMSIVDPELGAVTVNQMVEDYFQYEDFQILEIDYEGDDRAFGRFNGGEEAVGFSEGLVLTTGRARTDSTEIGADAVRDSFANTNYFGFYNDQDARNIPPAADTMQNLAALTMSIFTMTDTIYLDYLFGSEDYQDYNCVEGDDYFGIIVSGPGFEGDYSRNGELISTVPMVDSLPIRVSTVHPEIDTCAAQNDSFYQENEFGTQPVYSGLTQTFTRVLAVEKGQVYQIKFLIADGQFPAKDAGLFFNLRSCDTPICKLSIPETETFMEGCSDSLMVLDFSEYAAILPLNYEIIGTATPDVDYPAPANLSGVITLDNPLIIIDLNPFEDNINEPLETVILRISDSTGAQKDYFWTFSDGTENWSLNRHEICDNTGFSASRSLALYIESPLNSPTYDFNYTFNQTVEFPAQSFTFEVSGVPFDYLSSPFQINSICLNANPSSISYLNLYLVAPNGKRTKLLGDTSYGDNLDSCCFSPDARLPLGWSGGSGLTWQAPYHGTWQPDGLWEGLTGAQINGVWSLLVDRGGINTPNFHLKDIAISFRDAVMPDVPILWSDGYMGNFRNASETQAQANVSAIFQTETCLWTDSLQYNTDDNSRIDLEVDICEHDTLWVRDIPFSEVGDNPRGAVFFENGAYNGCDSIVFVELDPIYTIMTFEDYVLPNGEDLELLDTTLTEYGYHRLDYSSILACDSLHFVSFLPPPTFPDSSINGTLVEDSFVGCDSLTEVCIPTGYYGFANSYDYLVNGEMIGQSENLPRCESRELTCYSYSGINDFQIKRMNLLELDDNNESEWIYFNNQESLVRALNYAQGIENQWFASPNNTRVCAINSIGEHFSIERRTNYGTWSNIFVNDVSGAIANGMNIPFPEGENTLIVKKENAPDDTVFVNVTRELPSTQTEDFSITLIEDQSFLWELNNNELCGEIVDVELCNSPDLGLIDVNINSENGSILIFPYGVGEENVCVSFCDSIGICDTLNLTLNILDDGISATQTAELTALNVYPNPSSGIINIAVSASYKIEEVELYSLFGNKLRTYQSNSNQLKFNTLEFSQGVYYLKIKTNLGEVIRKITIVR